MIRESILVSVLSFFVSIITFINQLILANFFGAGELMDVYITASTIPTLISGLVTASLSYSLTPHLIKVRLTMQERDYGFYLRQMFLKLSFYSALLCLLSLLLQCFFIKAIFPAIDDSNLSRAVGVNILAWFTAYFFILIAFNSCYFNSNKEFKLPLFLSFIPYTSCIFFSIFFHQKISILAIQLGLLIGVVVSFLFSFISVRKDFRADVAGGNEIQEVIGSYFKSIPIVCISMLCFSVYQSIDAFWAPKAGSSTLSYLGYCQRILVAVGTLVILGPSTVLVPRLTAAIAENRKSDFLRDTTNVIKIVIALSSLIAVIGSLLAEEIIAIMFERGAFSRDDTLGVSLVLPYMLTGMVFMLCVVVLYRVFFIKNMISVAAKLGASSALIYFTFSGLGASRIGITGIGMAYIITWATILGLALNQIYKDDITFLISKDTYYFLIKQIFILLFVGLVVISVQAKLSKIVASNFLNSLITVFTCGLVGAGSYLVLSIRVFKLKEVGLFIGPILLKGKGRS